MLTNSASNLLTFNVKEVILKPFNDPWDNTYRRQNFLEFSYRSAYFGEFHHKDELLPIARFLLITSLVLLASAIIVLIRKFYTSSLPNVPMWSALICFFGGLFAFRFKHGCVPCQDFRYILGLSIPITYYVVQLSKFKTDFLNNLFSSLILLHAGLCIGFVLSL